MWGPVRIWRDEYAGAGLGVTEALGGWGHPLSGWVFLHQFNLSTDTHGHSQKCVHDGSKSIELMVKMNC